ncbi:hypothetical protein J3B02_000011 [Coemansia erecta]|nr:hypothetical protein J3B02_000011 [Coemansia erecta]
MSIQLTKELLNTFISNATRKAEQTLYTTHTISASAFGNTALFYLIPSTVYHPLRRFISLETPFILVSAFKEDSKEIDAKVRYLQTISCGAQPLALWRGLVGQKEEKEEPVNIAQPFIWESQKLDPLERNRARMLTAQYAQILPSLGCDGKQALPMVVFTSEYSGCTVQLPFYLVVVGPEADGGFANVVAIKHVGQRSENVVLVDRTDEQTLFCQNHWVEYDLLGSPVNSAEASSDSLSAALALLGSSRNPQDSIKQDDEDAACDDLETRSISDVDSVASTTDLGSSSSFVVFHGVWETEKIDFGVSVSLPLMPPPASSQWMLELVSTPLIRDTEAHSQLRKLYMEIKRLETWCECWMAGTKWMDTEQEQKQKADGGLMAQQSTAMFRCHEWQKSDDSLDSAEDRDNSEGASTGTVKEEDVDGASALEKHRSRLGKMIDRFIDTSIQGLLQESEVPIDSAANNDPMGAADPSDMLEFPVRQDLDFVEQLWLLAHQGHDDNDLSEMLAAVAEGLETRRLQPLIHANNQSPLAQVIRDALLMAQKTSLVDVTDERDRLAMQLDLWIDEQPLDAFVLMGIQKIRADFWYLLVAQRLATPRQIGVFLDPQLEPRCLVARFWCLLRVLEIWWLAKQAVPGLPRIYVNQIVASALDHFAAKLKTEGESGLVEKMYFADVKVAVYLPMYSSEVQDFVASIAQGFDPTRYAAMAMNSTQGHHLATKISSRMVQLTKTPALVDQHFSVDSDDSGNLLLDTSSQSEDTYTVFEASLF